MDSTSEALRASSSMTYAYRFGLEKPENKAKFDEKAKFTIGRSRTSVCYSALEHPVLVNEYFEESFYHTQPFKYMVGERNYLAS